MLRRLLVLVVLLLRRADVCGLVDDEQRVFWQMIEQRAVREEGRVGIKALEGRAGAQGFDVVLEMDARVAVEATDVHRVSEASHALAVERQLTRGADAQLVAHLRRALRRRIERADALDVVAEELDAQRLVFGRRPDVDDAAAACRLAGRGDGGLDAVAGGVERASVTIMRGDSPRTSPPGPLSAIGEGEAAVARRSSTSRRRRTSSGSGARRSYGSASRSGKTRTRAPSAPSQAVSSSARASAWWGLGVTMRVTSLPGPLSVDGEGTGE